MKDVMEKPWPKITQEQLDKVDDILSRPSSGKESPARVLGESSHRPIREALSQRANRVKRND
jgi:hypothetical protein